MIERRLKPDFQVRFRWRPDSAAFRDNRRPLPRGMRLFAAGSLGFPRTIEGDSPA
jgi:hypothetical protein